MKKSVLLFVFVSLYSATLFSQVTIGSDLSPNKGALLDIKETSGLVTSTKGFNLPRVSLQSTTSLLPCAADDGTSHQDHIGLTVYNVSASGGLMPGYYFWNGTGWVKVITEIPNTKTSLNMLSLTGNVSSVVGDTDGSGGVQFNFGDSGPIKIPEDGSYAFSLRIYGKIDVDTRGRYVYYISLWTDLDAAGNISYSSRMVDIAEINIVTSENLVDDQRYYTYSITLGGAFKIDDRVKFVISHPMSINQPWVLHGKMPGEGLKANCTTMIWWRL
ncbi:MAG: hypothetical protein LBR34_03820 [Prevotella sp.]|jgi:hypothetical protein|nr:hypothetical protein [Prevotella sp.]